MDPVATVSSVSVSASGRPYSSAGSARGQRVSGKMRTRETQRQQNDRRKEQVNPKRSGQLVAVVDGGRHKVPADHGSCPADLRDDAMSDTGHEQKPRGGVTGSQEENQDGDQRPTPFQSVCLASCARHYAAYPVRRVDAGSHPDPAVGHHVAQSSAPSRPRATQEAAVVEPARYLSPQVFHPRQ